MNRPWRNNGSESMRKTKIAQAEASFYRLEKAQKQWDESFNDLSEVEEAELEKRLFANGVTFTKIQSLDNNETVKKP